MKPQCIYCPALLRNSIQSAADHLAASGSVLFGEHRRFGSCSGWRERCMPCDGALSLKDAERFPAAFRPAHTGRRDVRRRPLLCDHSLGIRRGGHQSRGAGEGRSVPSLWNRDRARGFDARLALRSPQQEVDNAESADERGSEPVPAADPLRGCHLRELPARNTRRLGPRLGRTLGHQPQADPAAHHRIRANRAVPGSARFRTHRPRDRRSGRTGRHAGWPSGNARFDVARRLSRRPLRSRRRADRTVACTRRRTRPGGRHRSLRSGVPGSRRARSRLCMRRHRP